MSTLQVLATALVFDYLYDSAGLPLANREITVQLSFNKASYKSPVVSVPGLPIRVTTDSNGYWEARVVRNTDLNPGNTVYQVHGAGQSFDVSVPAGAGPFQASAIATGQLPTLVGGFSTAAGGTIGGNLIVTGNLAVGVGGLLTTIGGALTVAPTTDLILTPLSGLIKANVSLLLGSTPSGTWLPGDLLVNRGGVSPGTGAIFFGSSANLHNIYYDGTKFVFSDGVKPSSPAAGTGGTGTLFSGTGAPNNANGQNGDFYFRYDTPGTVNQRLYVRSAGAWVGIL